MLIRIEKAKRRLTLLDDRGAAVFSCAAALGFCPAGAKEKAGDGKTPEGRYFVCLKKIGKYGFSLGVSYPSAEDARRAGSGEELVRCIRERQERLERPPWGTPLGGEIYIHGGGAHADWTAGCVALADEDAERLYQTVEIGAPIDIVP